MSESKNIINVMHVVGSLGIGGAEMMLVHYTKALGNRHFNHFVYCFGNDGPVRSIIENLGVTVNFGPHLPSIKNPIVFSFNLILLLRNLVFIIKEKNINVIQAHNGQSNKLAIFIGKILGIPAFPTIHSTMALIDSRSILDPRVFLKKMIDNIFLKSADKVLAVSSKIKDIVCQTYGLEEDKVLVIKNGILLNQEQSNINLLEEEFPKSTNKLKLIAVGRLVPMKNFSTLIKATASIISQGNKELLVLIVGDGPKGNVDEKFRLLKLINELNLNPYVKLLGRRNDVLSLMRASDIFVIPSQYEGLSVAMIEAMACGLPIIGSNVPGLSDFISNQKNGLLFPVGDSEALAKCILNLATDHDLKDRLSKGAKMSFEIDYDMQRNIFSLSELFHKSTVT
ncbi:glycosyltransferase [uncultured Desulfosarcina sp.]|uniref:glycosyltransferase n=1 Tax=uncultured Desulfosarcina sp. TaxID=218289 RepID=UPI0029C9232D|nr:glycosyltransferase [uncultured Desulfosarcina sp.]